MFGVGRTCHVHSFGAPAAAQARGGFFPGLAGGLIAGAIFGDLASQAYGYGPVYAPYLYAPYAYSPYVYRPFAPNMPSDILRYLATEVVILACPIMIMRITVRRRTIAMPNPS